jgi:hypothetical protein
MNPGKIDLMPLDAIVLEKKVLMPVTGPSLVQNLGPDLGLEKNGGLADDLHDSSCLRVEILGGGLPRDLVIRVDSAADAPHARRF